MIQLIIFDALSRLIIGAFYALIALGLSLFLNLSVVINFAHGWFWRWERILPMCLIPYIGSRTVCSW
jgi:branched-chain amino acid transport system permease protein